MKVFSDLVFKPRTNFPFYSVQAIVDFDNGYAVYVTTSNPACSSASRPYNVDIMFNGKLCNDIVIDFDVVGIYDEDGVSNIMLMVQQFKKP